MSCVCMYRGTRCIGGYMCTCVFVCIGEQDVLGNICLHVCLCVYGNKMYWGNICVHVCLCVRGNKVVPVVHQCSPLREQ